MGWVKWKGLLMGVNKFCGILYLILLPSAERVIVIGGRGCGVEGVPASCK